LKVSVLGAQSKIVVRDTQGRGQLELVYLHGRVPQSGGHSGKLVMSERDYHTSHDRVSSELEDLFRADKSALLILGASMTDPPLLTALAATHERPSRYALIPVQSAGIVGAANSEDFEQSRAIVGLRGLHFGVRFLIPDFHYQIAQFCEEILACVGLAPDTASYLHDREQIRYGLRLQAWWDRWRDTEYYHTPDKIYLHLSDSLRAIRELLRGYGTREPHRETPEQLKIELWIRDVPTANRRLALWGSSVGTLVDRSILRAEDLRNGSGNASMRAFVEGQPQYVPQETLAMELKRLPQLPLRRSRWETFLSVPIRADDAPDGRLVGVPVGVVTLASMSKIRDSDIPYRSSKQMEELVQILTALGQTLLLA
jgi:SIR2-like domain